MDRDLPITSRRIDVDKPLRPPSPRRLRPARGLLVGLALSSIIWLGLLVAWLAH